MKKRTMIFVTAMVLLFAMVTGTTLAYMTSTTATVQNTFTYGNVLITLDEAPVDSDGQATNGARVTANSYRLFPGKTYDKDPTVHVDAASEDCYIFVKVVNPISSIEATGDTTIAAQMQDLGWTLVSGKTNVYAYNGTSQGTADATVSKGENIKVFETVTIADDAKFAGTYGQVTIEAFAVQAEGFASAAAAWTAVAGASETPTGW